MLQRWAGAIRDVEGMHRRKDGGGNNPGALRKSPFQTGTRSGFATFDTPDQGWKALVHQLRIAATGKSSVYKPSMTLYDFFGVYAPDTDRNNPKEYAEIVAKKLGVSPHTKISELAAGDADG